MTEKKKPGRIGVLSAAIDPLLLAGGKRVFQIAEAVVEQLDGKVDKKKVVNNIRSRITFLTTRKGYTFEKNALKQVRLVPPVEASSGVLVTSDDEVNETRTDAEVPVTETK